MKAWPKQNILKTLVFFLVGSFCMIWSFNSHASKHDQVIISASEHIMIYDEGSRKPHKNSRRNQKQSTTYYIYEDFDNIGTVYGREKSRRSKNRHRKPRHTEEYQIIEYFDIGRGGEQIHLYEMYE